MKNCLGFALLAYCLPSATHEPFGAMPPARTPFHAGVERAEMAQGDSVAAGAWQGLTRYVSGPVCVRMLEFKSKHRQVDFIVGEK